jgi:uncharacterized protein (DUF983 family)
MVPLPIASGDREDEVTEPTALQVSLGGLCPRCGAKTLFAGFARFATCCRACSLDFTAFNVGDGPAAFLTLGIGALITGLAIALELVATPPWWVHVLIWLPLTVALVMGSLRYSKGALLALEYRHRAREGRIVGDHGDDDA